MKEKELTFSAKAQEELEIFSRAVLRMLAISEGIFREENADSLYEAQALREVIGELGAQEDVEALYAAYEQETTRFVRSSYLTAL